MKVLPYTNVSLNLFVFLSNKWVGNGTIIQKNKIKDDVLGIPEFV
jgi:hypothetical protein